MKEDKLEKPRQLTICEGQENPIQPSSLVNEKKRPRIWRAARVPYRCTREVYMRERVRPKEE